MCLVCLCRAGCRHLHVPQNSRQPWDLKWLKSMGTWAWALLMCLGGPNYCRVGWVGSQSYLFVDWSSFNACRYSMCVLGRHVVFVVVCILFIVGWWHRVECVYYPCTHAHTQKKKKIHLLWEVFHRNEEARYNCDGEKEIQTKGVERESERKIERVGRCRRGRRERDREWMTYNSMCVFLELVCTPKNVHTFF